MTGNKVLDYLLELDSSTCLCELLDLIKRDAITFLKLFNETEPKVDYNNLELIERLKEIYTLVEYKLFMYDLPKWIYYKEFYNDIAVYKSKHLSDFEKAKLFLSAHWVFRERNIYFDLRGLERV